MLIFSSSGVFTLKTMTTAKGCVHFFFENEGVFTLKTTTTATGKTRLLLNNLCDGGSQNDLSTAFLQYMTEIKEKGKEETYKAMRKNHHFVKVSRHQNFTMASHMPLSYSV